MLSVACGWTHWKLTHAFAYCGIKLKYFSDPTQLLLHSVNELFHRRPCQSEHRSMLCCSLRYNAARRHAISLNALWSGTVSHFRKHIQFSKSMTSQIKKHISFHTKSKTPRLLTYRQHMWCWTERNEHVVLNRTKWTSGAEQNEMNTWCWTERNEHVVPSRRKWSRDAEQNTL